MPGKRDLFYMIVGAALLGGYQWQGQRRAEVAQIHDELNRLTGELAQFRASQSPPLSSAVGPEPGLWPAHEAAPAARPEGGAR